MVEICLDHDVKIMFDSPSGCPLCAAERKLRDLYEELGRKDYEVTQLEGTIADLREKLTPEPK